jgi:tetratricopeptide (TPR) repeat protein
MEFVKGVPIHEYADRSRLTTRDRLELFIQVCDGVQHAHQKGIIHRDLKPSNVLVTDEDGRRVPKIIDFGVAKATAQRLTEKTLFTEMGQLIGTPEYMSPEQAEMSGLDIDTRTDVYLLGVLLYELLTGELPFDTRELRRVGFNEFRRRVLEEDPPRPSTRLTRADESTRQKAAARRVDLSALSRQLRGDLDWITMKALEKDRTRRYPSASELAADVARFLHHEPVLASPPSNLYRLRKFTRRHKAGAGFAAVLLVLLTGFAVMTTIQNRRIASQAKEKEAARAQAVLEANAARGLADLLREVFEVSDPSKALGNTMTPREILERGAAGIRTGALREHPLLQARMMRTIGSVYGSLGLVEDSRLLLDEALRIQVAALDDEHLEIAETLEALADLVAFPFGEFRLAGTYYERALTIRKNQLGSTHPTVAVTLNRLGNLLASRGEHELALEKYDGVLAVLESSREPDRGLMAKVLNNRGRMLMVTLADYERALPMFERALQMMLSAAEPDRATRSLCEHNLGSALELRGDYAAARRHHEAGLSLRREMFGSEPHQKMGESLLALARLSLREGEIGPADRLHAEAMEIFRKSTSASGSGSGGGLDDPSVLYDLAGYAALRGRTAEALRLLRRAAVEKRYYNAEVLLRDPNLKPIRDSSEFRSILADVQARARDA